MLACEVDNTQVIEELMKVNAKVNIQSKKDGLTALMIAAKRNNIMATEMLLGRSTDINVNITSHSSSGGKTALMVAAEYNRGNILKMLIAAKADLFLKDSTGRTAWDIADAVSMKTGNDACKAIIEKAVNKAAQSIENNEKESAVSSPAPTSNDSSSGIGFVGDEHHRERSFLNRIFCGMFF